MKVLITGGYGFIGGVLASHLMDIETSEVVCVDNLQNATKDIHSAHATKTAVFDKKDITSFNSIASCIQRHQPDIIFNAAAETNVDSSFQRPLDFVHTNILGTAQILQAANEYWIKLRGSKKKNFRFIHISTDEVYGPNHYDAGTVEGSLYNPTNPYSATKAGADHLVYSWNRSWGFPAIVTYSSNNYGPGQSLDKFVPKVITNCLLDKEIPIYGDGMQKRDWIYVDDHARALIKIMKMGRLGEGYNISANKQKTNLETLQIIIDYLDTTANRGNKETFHELVKFVEDRISHDTAYNLNSQKLRKTTGWRPNTSFTIGLKKTVDWYLNNISNLKND